MARRLTLWMVLAWLAPLLLGACGERAEKTIDKALVGASVRQALYFDLDEPVQGSAAVIVPTNAAAPELRTVVAPFPSKSPGGRQAPFSAWGSQSGLTLITYLASPSEPATSVLQMRALYQSGDDADFQRNDLKGTLYLMSSGLKRRFVYQWPAASSVAADQWEQLSLAARSSFESVLVKLPVDAEVFERDSDSLAPLSERASPEGILRMYPHPGRRDATVTRIDIRYQIQPTKLQNQLFDYLIKLFGVLLVPIVGLIVLTSDKVKAPRLRRYVLVVGMTLELVILAGMLAWAFYVENVAGLGAVFEVILALVGALLLVVMARIKGEV